ncbi:MAG: response regulator, partial [Ktedonobacterales bacterium]
MATSDLVTASRHLREVPEYWTQRTCDTSVRRHHQMYVWNSRHTDERDTSRERKATTPSARPDERATVLVVDDETSIAALLDELLESAGYRVLVAYTGRAALALARSERPALILTDCKMPGIDGAEFVRQLRSSPVTNNIPVVMMSSIRPEYAAREDITGLRTSEEHIMRTVKRGVYLALVGDACLPFLEKPFDIDVVLSVVETATANG